MRSRSRPTVSSNGSSSPNGDALGQLRSNLEMAMQELERPSVMVTCPTSREDATPIAGQVARLFAAARRRVILVDFNLDRPALHRMFDVDNARGVTDIVGAGRSPKECLRYLPINPTLNGDSRGMYLLPAGELSNAAEDLLESERTRQLLNGLERAADLVVISAPPVLGTAESMALGRRVGGALLVVEAGRTSVAVVEEAKARMQGNQVRLVGAVLTTASRRSPKAAG